jgi:hypothetical protein
LENAIDEQLGVGIQNFDLIQNKMDIVADESIPGPLRKESNGYQYE